MVVVVVVRDGGGGGLAFAYSTLGMQMATMEDFKAVVERARTVSGRDYLLMGGEPWLDG